MNKKNGVNINRMKKGGESKLEQLPFLGFKEINKKGLYIADDIDYNIRQGKKKDLIEKYEGILTEAKTEVENARLAQEDENFKEKLRI